ncbi:MFS transporter [Variovorax sp. HJSM1_2]|uniref:MFS transporter n=1 Tax=Variovorax sp. HJSM1_2 TaxID=3366263 RepID=UPI003BD01F62
MSQTFQVSTPGERLRQRKVLAGVCLASAAMPMTFTGPAVALRDIAQALGGSPVALAWVTNAFMLAFGSCLMVAGALADRHGRRRLFMAGLLLFVGASTALVAAPSLLLFDLLRAVQGVAGAAIFAGGASALAQEFAGRARLQAFSLLGTSFGLGLTLGPIAAGGLTAAFGWRAIFVLVIACAVVSWALARCSMHESRDPQAQALDWPGAISFTAALTLFTCGVLEAPALGWAHPGTLWMLLGALTLLALFVRIERRAQRPMLDLTLFRYPRFVGVQLLAAAPAYAYVVLLVLLPIRFIGVEGVPVGEAGRWMMALSAPLVVLPLVAGWLARRFAPASICGAGLLMAAAGLVWLSQVGGGSRALLPMALIGVGISLPWGLMDGLAVSVVPSERAGMATGIFSTTRVAGEGLALALVGALLSALTAQQLAGAGAYAPAAALAAQELAAGNLQAAAALLPGQALATVLRAYDAAFATLMLVLAAITVLTAVVVFVFLRRGADVEQRGLMPLAQNQ